MATGMAPATANAVLNAYFNQTNITAPTSIWIQLHTADPGAAGTTAVASNATRKDVTAVFAAAASGAVTSDTAVTWTNVPAAEDYSFFSIWTASSAGTFLWSGSITANAVSVGDSFTFGVGDIDVSFGVAA